MKKLLIIFLFPFLVKSQQDTTHHWRPTYHFSPQKNWTNDPNGLVFHEGEWHLFFQHNPYENKWGHMSWGHAISKDLMTWEELPIAIPEDSVWIFSGCVVIDKTNSAGFGKDAMVAVYTADYHGEKENQHLAYSTDKGRTWKKYEKNPIIPAPLNKSSLQIGIKDFRDPNIIFHKPTQQWIMTVALPKEYKVHFYGSKDLKNWTFLSEFGQQGDTKKIWECPALIQLPMSNEKLSVNSNWVLLISSKGAYENFTGMQYFVGDFEGKNFKNVNPPETSLFLDYGKDFYAAIPFSNTEKKLILGWMSDWQYAESLPTFPWKGQMTLPREIELKNTPEGLRIYHKPATEVIESKKWKNVMWTQGLSINGGQEVSWLSSTASYRIDIEFEIEEARDFGLKLFKNGESQETIVGYQADNQQLYINRINAGKIIHKDFPSMETAPMKSIRNRVKMQVFIDKSSVEVFGNEGETVITDLVFPEKNSLGWQIFSNDGKVKVVELSVFEWDSEK